MLQQEGFKKYLPHLWAIGIFLVISCIFCYPALQGKILDQHDTKSWMWSSKESRDIYEKTGHWPQWTNSTFSGMFQAGHSPLNLYGKVLEVIFACVEKTPVSFFMLAMLCFYLLASVLGINRWLAIIGAVAFAFSSYNPTAIAAGHNTKIIDLALLPGIVAGVILAYRGKYWQGAAITGIFLFLYIMANHLQIIYYSIFLVLALSAAALAGALRRKETGSWIKASLVLALAAGAACLANASTLLQTEEYSHYSIRGGTSELSGGKDAAGQQKSTGLDKDYAFSWSNGRAEVLSILVPGIYGGSSNENIGEDSHFGKKLSDLGAAPDAIETMTRHANLYWGPQPMLAGSAYFGAVVCFLFVLSLFVIRSQYKWWLVGAALFFMLLSMGKNFATLNYFLFDHFPLFNKFRSPNMAISLSSLIFPLMAVWALRDIFAGQISKEEVLKKLKLSLLITGGLCLVILIASQTMMDYKGERDDQMAQQYGGEAGKELVKALREDRSAETTGDAFRSLIFVLLAGGVLWAYSKDKAGRNTTIAILGVLIVIDLLPVGYRWMDTDNYTDPEEYQAQNFAPSPADAQILQDKDPYYRVFDISGGDPFSDAKPSYFHKSVGGYSALKMRIYQDLIEHQLGKLNHAVLNMLNTKYLIVPAQAQNQPPGVIPNPGALGNAWFVSDVQWVKTADEEMNALDAPPINNPGDTAAGSFNPGQTAVLRETHKDVLGSYAFGRDSAAYIRLQPDGYAPDHLKFESNNNKDGLAIFSDIYYPLGWKATVDGKETPIVQADYVLRAIKVPAGKHAIEFSLEATPATKSGNRLALAGTILLTLLFGAGIYFGLVRKTAQPAAAPGNKA
ncbi:YfhO family protein [Taibaiella koreensis]|uniref:YfhO family protein n=1 Tax=Taibaiella koreensis TaxID=1268548 RepID=UPI000E59E11A|nr:YfhO family protein [Taibaiella koreensis]